MKKINDQSPLPKKGTILQNFTSFILKSPKRLFLIDAIGAGYTGSVLFFLIGQNQDLFGMPIQAVHILGIIAFLYFLYSITCHFLVKRNWKPFLKIIAIANQLYCVVTILFLFSNYNSLTAPGWGYFSIEILVIFILSLFEWKISNSLE
jgi:hypothetical protein